MTQKIHKSSKAYASKNKKRTLQDNMKLLLSLPVSRDDEVNELKELGINDDIIDNNMLVAFGLYKNAKKGDLSAMKEIIRLTSDGGEGEGANAPPPVNIIDDIKPIF